MRYPNYVASFLSLWIATAGAQDADGLFQQGRFEEAAQRYAAWVAEHPDDGMAWHRLGYSLHATQRYDEALEAHERSAQMVGPWQVNGAYNAACAHALLGHDDDALAWLRRAADLGFQDAGQMRADPDLASLRETPAFAAVLARLKATGQYPSMRPGPPGNARQFDFWIGEWDTVAWSLRPSGRWAPTGQLRMKVFPILDGEGIVEFAEGSIGAGPTLGFSLRAYDPTTERWTLLLNWPGPEQPRFYTLTGAFRHGRGEFFTPLATDAAGNATQTRYTFSDAADDRLRWDGASTQDGGRSWSTNLIFEFTRRVADAPPLPNGPSRVNSHATGEEFRALDFALGDWVGTRNERGDAATARVSLRVESVMEGSALTCSETITRDEVTGAGFGIVAFEPALGAWTRYGMTQGSPRFNRHRGVANPGEEITWSGEPGPGSDGSPWTITWRRAEDGGLIRRCVDDDGHEVWRDTLTRASSR